MVAAGNHKRFYSRKETAYHIIAYIIPLMPKKLRHSSNILIFFSLAEPADHKA